MVDASRMEAAMDRTRSTRRTRVVAGLLALGAAGLLLPAMRGRGGSRSRAPGEPEPPAPEWIRSFVARTFNPAVVRLGLVGGRRSPWAYLEHVGRRSGTRYRTPVLPVIARSHAFVPLPYGEEVNWARNTRAAGTCRLGRRGLVYDLDEPAVIAAKDHAGVPAWYRGWLERRGRRYLRLHVLAVTPGTLDDVAAPARDALPVPARPEAVPDGATPTVA
jgi:hypothetical protein